METQSRTLIATVSHVNNVSISSEFQCIHILDHFGRINLHVFYITEKKQGMANNVMLLLEFKQFVHLASQE